MHLDRRHRARHHVPDGRVGDIEADGPALDPAVDLYNVSGPIRRGVGSDATLAGKSAGITSDPDDRGASRLRIPENVCDECPVELQLFVNDEQERGAGVARLRACTVALSKPFVLHRSQALEHVDATRAGTKRWPLEHAGGSPHLWEPFQPFPAAFPAARQDRPNPEVRRAVKECRLENERPRGVDARGPIA